MVGSILFVLRFVTTGGDSLVVALSILSLIFLNAGVVRPNTPMYNAVEHRKVSRFFL